MHGDFAERNVLELDGDIRIIDFDQTESHNCQCKMDFRPGEKTPDAVEFGCDQLWNVCRCDMGIWDLGQFYRSLLVMLIDGCERVAELVLGPDKSWHREKQYTNFELEVIRPPLFTKLL